MKKKQEFLYSNLQLQITYKIFETNHTNAIRYSFSAKKKYTGIILCLFPVSDPGASLLDPDQTTFEIPDSDLQQKKNENLKKKNHFLMRSSHTLKMLSKRGHSWLSNDILGISGNLLPSKL